MKVIIEMDGHEYDNMKEKSEIGEKILNAIKSLEHSSDIKGSRQIVDVNDKKYEISIVRWKGLKDE